MNAIEPIKCKCMYPPVRRRWHCLQESQIFATLAWTCVFFMCCIFHKHFSLMDIDSAGCIWIVHPHTDELFKSVFVFYFPHFWGVGSKCTWGQRGDGMLAFRSWFIFFSPPLHFQQYLLKLCLHLQLDGSIWIYVQLMDFLAGAVILQKRSWERITKSECLLC